MLYYTIPYHAIPYYTILYYTILYYTILYYTILYYTILYYTILYFTLLYFTLQSTSSYFLLMNILGYVHTGMYTGALGILDGYGMRGYLLDLAARGYDIRIVGHSLGAGNCSWEIWNLCYERRGDKRRRVKKEGKKEGKKDGKKEGRNKGRKGGREEGRKKERKEGRKKVRKEGK